MADLDRWADATAGITRRAHPIHCHKCRQLVIRGLDADVLAFDLTYDPLPLTVENEIQAILEGRQTVELRNNGDRISVERRYAWNMTRPVAGPVLCEHRCGPPIGQPATSPPPAPALEAADACPF